MIEDMDDVVDALADLYEGARENHWAEAERLAEWVTDYRETGRAAVEAVDRDRFRSLLKEMLT